MMPALDIANLVLLLLYSIKFQIISFVFNQRKIKCDVRHETVGMIPKKQKKIHEFLKERKNNCYFQLKCKSHESRLCVNVQHDHEEKLFSNIKVVKFPSNHITDLGLTNQMNVLKNSDEFETVGLGGIIKKGESDNLSSTASPSDSELKIEQYLHQPGRLELTYLHPVEIEVNYVATPIQIHGYPWTKLNNEYYRIATFVNFPPDGTISISTLLLASRGFVYVGNGLDYTSMCYFCSLQLKELDELKNSDHVHNSLSANCPIVRARKCSNVSMRKHSHKEVLEVFKQLDSLRQYKKQNISPVDAGNIASPVVASSPQEASETQNNARSSQPSDEQASSVLVTNTSDLAEGDNAQVTQNSQSSQLMDDAVINNPPQTHPDGSETTSSAVIIESDSQQSNSPPDNSQDGRENSSDGNSGDNTSYEDLGIITARPKRPEFAILATRMNSFDEWPVKHYMKPDDLAKAGFFYTGYSDCARCFYCGGGLRNWEREDNVWVEHARWFSKCSFLRQEVGYDFIVTVQDLRKLKEEISYNDVITRMQCFNIPTPLERKQRCVERDPAVLSVVDNGYDKDQIFRLALGIRKEGEILSSDKLFEEAQRLKFPLKNDLNNLESSSVSIRREGNEERDQESIMQLRSENGELRQQMTCKICMDSEVAVVFLPCGHFVSCTECSCALNACPLCRVGIKGIVRGFLG